MISLATGIVEPLLAQDTVVDIGAYHGVDEDAAGVDGIGVELAERVEVLDLGDDVVGTHGGRHVEVTRRAAVDEVAPGVASVSPDDGDVALEGRHQDVCAAVELDELLALFGDRSNAGGCEEATQPGAAAAHHLGQRALRRGFDLEDAFVHGLAHPGGSADVAGDDLPDLPQPGELEDAALAVAGVVGVEREILHVHRLEVVDEREGIALTDEAADSDAHPRVDVAQRLTDRDHLVLGHLGLLTRGLRPSADPRRLRAGRLTLRESGVAAPARVAAVKPITRFGRCFRSDDREWSPVARPCRYTSRPGERWAGILAG
jgi:hypothetical protein